MIILLEFLVFILILINILAPPIYLGSQLSKAFYDKRSIFLLVVFKLFATFVFPSFSHVANLLFFYIIFWIVLKKKKKEALFLALYLFVFYQSIRYLILTFIIRLIFDYSELSDFLHSGFNSVFSLISLFLSVVILRRWGIDFNILFLDKFQSLVMKSMWILSLLFGFRLFSSIMSGGCNPFYVRFDTTISLLIFILFFSWLFYIRHLEQVYRDEQTIQRQEDENRSLQGMVDKLGHLYDEVRGFRHDFAGIVASMEPAIANQDMAEVSTIYQDVFLKTNEKLRKADYTAFNLHNIHDIAIRNTLAKAMIVADNQGIHFSLETVGVVEELALPMLEAIRILSILTTNALEAASEAENPQIRVALLAGDRSVRFIIENTRKKEELNPSILSQKGYSTKGNHSGLGLATLEDMVFHYDLNLDTQLGETTFRQDLELPFKDEKRGGEE